MCADRFRSAVLFVLNSRRSLRGENETLTHSRALSISNAKAFVRLALLPPSLADRRDLQSAVASQTRQVEVTLDTFSQTEGPSDDGESVRTKSRRSGWGDPRRERGGSVASYTIPE